jgi:hypothetical protein
MTISDDPDQGWSSALDSNVWSQRFVPERSAQSSALRHQGLPAMAATGITSLSCAVWLEPL